MTVYVYIRMMMEPVVLQPFMNGIDRTNKHDKTGTHTTTATEHNLRDLEVFS